MNNPQRLAVGRINASRLLAVLVALLHPFTCSASDAIPSGYAPLVRQAAPSVVTVIVEELRIGAGERAAARATADIENDAVGVIVRRLLSGANGNPGGDERASRALGSGFVIRADGLIVTNRHVIAAARTVRVRLEDGRELPAKIVGVDAVTDIALLKVSAGNLPALRFGSTQAVSVGDAVIAIGNPFGLGQSVSAGIISARARTLEDDPYIDFLQTDAAINRGNSGGPLLSTAGTVIGVTSAILSPSGGSVGLGFGRARLYRHLRSGHDPATGEGARYEDADRNTRHRNRCRGSRHRRALGGRRSTEHRLERRDLQKFEQDHRTAGAEGAGGDLGFTSR
jgi:S1-C subfamily serine protease